MDNRRPTLTQERVHQLLTYNQNTGLFNWIGKKTGTSENAIAGCLAGHGYIVIRIDFSLYYAHRLAWLYMTGRWPKNHIDHINGNKSDNKWSNLREATRSQNLQNRGLDKDNTTGYKGVWYNKPNRTYYADIRANGKRFRSTPFKTAKEAHEWYCEKAKKLHGEFSKFG